MKLIFLIPVFFIFSCTHKKEKFQPFTTKLLFTLDPSFDESSLITYLDSNNQKTLSIFIRKDFFRNTSSEGIKDTLYYKSVVAKASKLESIIYQLKRFQKPKDIVIVDGMNIHYTLVIDQDTINRTYQSPLKKDSIAYNNTRYILEFCRDTFEDPTITGYFSILNTYMGEEEFDRKLVAPFLLLREKKYPGKFKFNPTN